MLANCADTKKSEKRSSTINSLRQQISNCLDKLIPSRARCAIIDFPNHANVGDSAIYLGEIAYLRSRQCEVIYVCDHENYNSAALRTALLKDGIIIIHGGGNFGDLYPHHQILREKVTKDFPDNRIVQMPQSIHFQHFEKLLKARNVIEAHSDFHLLLRDNVSFEFANKNLPTTSLHLCPDMALMLEIEFPKNKKKYFAATISRTDEEKTVVFSGESDSSILITDWLSEPKPLMQWFYDWAHLGLSGNRSRFFFGIKNYSAVVAARAMARQRLVRGLSILAQGENIITDRLHAVILGWLGGSNVFYSDNKYKKLENFLNTWLPESVGIKSFEKIADAVDYCHRQTRNRSSK